MKNYTNFDPMSPANPLEQAVQQKYENLKLPVPFAKFRSQVAARMSEVETSNFLMDSLSSMTPVVFAQCIRGTLPCSSRLQRRVAGRQEELVNVIERALAYCIAAKLLRPKPLRSLLEEVVRHNHLHDQIVAAHALEDHKRNASCASGGRARHWALPKVQCRAARLLRIKAPLKGWESKAHAAREIAEPLIRYIRLRRFSMSSCPTSVLRNVQNWIVSEPVVGNAFNQYRRPQVLTIVNLTVSQE